MRAREHHARQRDSRRVVGLRRHDHYLIINPFFHAFGYKAGWLGCLLAGAVLYPMAVFDVEQALRTVERERITVFPGPPTVFWSLLESNSWQEADLSTLRMTITGSTGVPTSLLLRMRDDLGFRDICVGYGLTEANGLGTMCRPGDPIEVATNTNGPPIPGMELRITPDGEILLRGHVMKDYSTTRRPRPRRSTPRAGCIPVTSASWTPARTCSSWTVRRTFSWSGASTCTRPSSRGSCSSTRRSRAPPSSAPPTSGWVRWRSVHRAGGRRDGRRGRADHVVPRADRRFKVPRHVTLCTELPLTANGKVRKDVLRARSG